jgi:hypothetical protein
MQFVLRPHAHTDEDEFHSRMDELCAKDRETGATNFVRRPEDKETVVFLDDVDCTDGSWISQVIPDVRQAHREYAIVVSMMFS